jgi:hypothetical protein
MPPKHPSNTPRGFKSYITSESKSNYMTAIPDPAENHRAGYHKDKLQYVMEWVRRHPDSTLSSGEGKILLDEIDRLLEEIDPPEDSWKYVTN